MGKYISQKDLENALTSQTVGNLFADEVNTGQVNVGAIEDVIDRAEGEVDSFLIGYEKDVASLNGSDRLLKGCALDFAKCFSFERDPEYVRTYGEDPRGYMLYKRAVQRMERIQEAVQRLPDQPNQSKPANVGGIVVTTGPNIVTPSLAAINSGIPWNSGF